MAWIDTTVYQFILIQCVFATKALQRCGNGKAKVVNKQG